MGRRPARRRSLVDQPWGLVLAVVLVFSLNVRNWTGSAWLAVALLVYLGGVRRTRCRVETRKRQPCKWRVRGYLRCCEYHAGQNLKLRWPVLHRDGHWLPVLMWPRGDLATARPVPQPSSRSGDVSAGDRRWSAQERVATAIALASLLVAIMSFVRNLIAG